MTGSQEQPKNLTLVCCHCHQDIKNGKIYEIDDFKWHEDCFLCSRCHKKLQKNDNFITLPQSTETDDIKLCKLICDACSNTCQKCGKQINDMAIILSSNEAYCQECFKCHKCGKSIDDLKYVKTKKGLYCIDCHKILLAKRRLYKDRQLKKQEEKERMQDVSRDQGVEHSSVKDNTPESLFLPKRSSMRPKNDYLFSNADNLSAHRHSRSVSNSKLSDFETKIPDHTSRVSLSPNDSVTESKANHSRSVSLDDVLNATLQNDVLSLCGDDNNDEITNDIRESKEIDQLGNQNLQSSRAHLITPTNSIPSSSIAAADNHTSNNIPSDSSLRSKTSLLDVVGNNNNNNNNNMNLLLKTPELNKRSESVSRAINLPLNSPMSTVQSSNTAMRNSKSSANERTEKRSSKIFDILQESPIHNLASLNKGLALHFDNAHEQGSKMTAITSPDQSNNFLKTKNMNNFVTKSSGSDSNNTTNSGGKKLGRSLSLKSKNFFSHWKNKGHNFPSNDLNIVDENFDTHAGWGVVSNDQNNMHIGVDKNMITANRKSATFTRHSSRGKSDTLIYNKSKPMFSVNTTQPTNLVMSSTNFSTPRNQHQRNNSNGGIETKLTPGVAMFRTPPLDNQTMFRRIPQSVSSSVTHSVNSPISRRFIDASDNDMFETTQTRSLNRNPPSLTNDGKNDNTTLLKESSTLRTKGNTTETKNTNVISQNSTKDSESDSEDEEDKFVDSIDDMDIKLRKMKLELKELEVSKQKLIIEIGSLRNQRDELIEEIDKLNQSKKMYSNGKTNMLRYNNVGIFNDGISITRKNIVSPEHERTQPHTNLNVSKPKFWKLFSSNNTSHDTTGNLSATHSLVNSGDLTLGRNEVQLNSGDFINNEINDSGNGGMVALTSVTSRENSSVTDTSNSMDSCYNLSLHQYCLNSKNNLNVPDIMFKCINFIETNKRNLEAEGLYRKSGSLSLVEDVEKRLYVENGDLDLESDDVHVVTNVLKRFLRRLPDPVFTFEIYDPLISLVKDNNLIENLPLALEDNVVTDNKLFEFAKESVTKLLRQLPEENIKVLGLIIKHINLVSQYHRFNLMNLHNLALVFTPSLIHDMTGERDMIDMKERNYIVEFTLLHKLI